jgi:calcium binding protein 39
MKIILYGDGENDPVPEHVTQLATEMVNNNLLLNLVESFHLFEFEAKKDVSQIFNNLLRRQLGTRFPTADYVASKPEILMKLIKGHSVINLATKTRRFH